MNLHTILITLLAKDDVSPATARAAAAIMTMGGIAGAQGLRMAAVFSQITGASLAMAGGIGLAAATMVKAYTLVVDAQKALGRAFVDAVSDAARWEHQFAEVRKVLGADAGIPKLETDILNLALRLPVATEELAKLAAIGAQMDIPTNELSLFVETAARMSATVEGISTEKMALQMGRLRSQTGATTEEMNKMASTAIKLSVETVANTAQIVQGAIGYASLAHQIGISREQIISLSATMASLDPRIERNSTAMFNMMRVFRLARDEGGKSAALFGKIIGETEDGFRKLAASKPDETFHRVMIGLGGVGEKGTNVNRVLMDLGFVGSKTGAIFTQLAGNSDKLTKNLASARAEIQTGSAIVEQSNLRWNTLLGNLTLLSNASRVTAIEFGKTFLPALNAIAKALVPVGEEMVSLARDFQTEFGPAVKSAGDDLAETLIPALVDAVRAVGDLAKAISGSLYGVDSLSTEWSHFIAILQVFTGGEQDKHVAGMNEMIAAQIPILGMLLVKWREFRREQQEQRDAFVGPPEPTSADKAKEEADADAAEADAERIENIAKNVAKSLFGMREELDKLKDVHRNTYQAMVADIERGLVKRLEEIRANKDASDAQRAALIELAVGISKAEAVAAGAKALETLLGPKIGAAAAQWDKLAGSLKFAAEVGIEPTNEQLRAGIPLIDEWGATSKRQLDEWRKSMPEVVRLMEQFVSKVKEIPRDIPILKIEEGALRPLLERKQTEDDIVKAKVKQITAANELAETERRINQLVLTKLVDLGLTDAQLKRITEELGLGEAATNKIKDATFDWAKLLSTVVDIFKLFGIEANSTLGRVLSSITAIAGVYDMMRDDKGNRRSFGSLSDSEKLQVGAAGIGVISNIEEMGNNERDADKRVLAGGAAGAAFGFSVGGPWGALIGGLAGAVHGYFAGPNWAGTAKTAATLFGFEVSNELGKKIHDTIFEFGISAKDAALLNLPAAMAESGEDARTFGANIIELMARVAEGAIPAQEGIKAIGESFSAVAAAAADAGTVGDRAMVDIIKQARALGLEIPEISAHVQASLQKAIDAMAGLVGTADKDGNVTGGIPLTAGTNPVTAAAFGLTTATTEQNARDQALIFSSVFWASVAELGLAQSIDAMKGPFEALRQAITEAFGPEFAAELLGPMQGMFAVFTEGPARDALNGVTALQQALIGLADSGYLTTASFDALQRQAVNAFQAMIEGGATTEAAIMAMVPMIQAAISAAEQLGVPLSADMQRLRELAEQNGVTFRTDPMQAMVDILLAIADVLGAVIPEAARKAGAAIRGIPAPPNPGGFEPDDDGGQAPDQSNATGFYTPSLPKDTIIKAHYGEEVSIGPGGGNRGSGSPDIAAALMALRDEQRAFNRTLPKVIRDAVVMGTAT